MSEPADSPAPKPEDAESESRAATPASDRPRSETPMGDARPEDTEAIPAQPTPEPDEPAPVTAGVPVTPGSAAQAPDGVAPQAPDDSEASPTPARPASRPQQPPPSHPAGPLTHAQYQPQAGYYQQMQRPRPMLPPNPRWDRPDSVPNPAAVLLAVVIALFGGWAAFTTDGVGIGLSLTGIAFTAVPLAMGDRKDLLPRLPGAVLVAALWSVAAIRDAGWVVFLCTTAAFLLTPLVFAPQRRFSGTAVTLMLGWIEGLAAAFGWARRSRRQKEGRSGANMRNVWVAVVTAGLLIVFGGLFAAADSTFAGLMLRLVPEVNAVEFLLRLCFAAFLFPLALLWIYTAVAKPSFDSTRPEGGHRVVSRFELAVPLGALNLLFIAFIAVQARVFIGGEAYVMATDGLKFAEYARKGFWQLSFVAALALAVIAVAAWLAPKRAKADRWAARILLGTLCVLSMVVIASALYRMYTYADTYGLTRMRVWIFTVEIWLAVLFALVIVCCWKLRASWLPRAVVASGALALLGLAAVNPDALIARFNIEHDHKLDTRYLGELSADAIPELTALSYEDRRCATDWSRYDWEDREPMAWNLGFARAYEFRDEFSESSFNMCDEFFGYDDDVYGAPPPEDLQDPDAGYLAAPPPAAYFDTSTCDRIDTSGAAELLGAGSGLTLSDTDSDAILIEEEPVTAQLTCGYYDGALKVQGGLEYMEGPAAAASRVDDAEAAYEGTDWHITDLGDGWQAETTTDGIRQAQYYRAYDNLVLYAWVFGVEGDHDAWPAAMDLTAQMEDLYYTFA